MNPRLFIEAREWLLLADFSPSRQTEIDQRRSFEVSLRLETIHTIQS